MNSHKINYFVPNHQAISPADGAYNNSCLVKDQVEVAMRGDIMLNTGNRAFLLNFLRKGVTWLITRGRGWSESYQRINKQGKDDNDDDDYYYYQQ